MRQEQFLGEELSEAENRMETARFEVVPCGLEATVSYGTGAAKGPAAIIAASHQLERLIDGKVPCADGIFTHAPICLLYTSPSPRDLSTSRMPSSA